MLCERSFVKEIFIEKRMDELLPGEVYYSSCPSFEDGLDSYLRLNPYQYLDYVDGYFYLMDITTGFKRVTVFGETTCLVFRRRRIVCPVERSLSV